jgi:CheY-like chemotaxis protein
MPTPVTAPPANSDEWLDQVAHDLRSPLNAIRGWAHVLRGGGELTAAQARALAAIDRSVSAQARLIDDLLDTQRLVSGTLQLERGRVLLPALLQDALSAVATAASDKQVRLSLAPMAEAGLTVVADPQRLRQVLVNLLTSAIKFTTAHGSIGMRCARHAAVVVVEIADTGQPGRTGIDLAMACHVIQLHGGRVLVKSVGGEAVLREGTTVSIELPLPADQVAAEPPAAVQRPVLLVDDDPETRELLEQLFSDAGQPVRVFASAAAAYAYLLEAGETQRPRLVVSDIEMPGEDGYSFIQRVRQLDQDRQAARLPALALTACTRPLERQRALDAGFDAHLGKPVDPQLLRATVEHLLHTTDP